MDLNKLKTNPFFAMNANGMNVNQIRPQQTATQTQPTDDNAANFKGKAFDTFKVPEANATNGGQTSFMSNAANGLTNPIFGQNDAMLGKKLFMSA